MCTLHPRITPGRKHNIRVRSIDSVSVSIFFVDMPMKFNLFSKKCDERQETTDVAGALSRLRRVCISRIHCCLRVCVCVCAPETYLL